MRSTQQVSPQTPQLIDEVFRSDVELVMLQTLDASPIHTIVADSIRAGGKRLRPLLVLAGAPAAAHNPDHPRWDALVAAGAAVEMVHTASMIHDDVLDNAMTRRGKPSVAFAHGERAATAAGDTLFAHAFTVLTSLVVTDNDSVSHRNNHGDTALYDDVAWAVARLARCAQTLAEGEALQSEQQGNVGLDIDAYRARCNAKTGALFSAALEMGTVLGGGDSSQVDLCLKIGAHTGIAFQIIDDVLDCLPADHGTELGKSTGTDLLDGTVTAPHIFACEQDDSLAALIAQVPGNHELLAETQQRIATTDAIHTASLLAVKHVEQARIACSALGDGHDQNMLAAMLHLSISRMA